jgi:hypothetical protein
VVVHRALTGRVDREAPAIVARSSGEALRAPASATERAATPVEPGPSLPIASASARHRSAPSASAAGRPLVRDKKPEPSDPGPAVVAAPAEGRTESELELLRRARDALPSDPAAALSIADVDRARFPSGPLAQEREVIAIDALTRLGRGSEARSRAKDFFDAFPSSAYRPRILALVGAAAGEDHNR